MAREVLEYHLRKDQAAGTTGYLTCVPTHIEEMQEALTALASHPQDAWLYGFILDNLAECHYEIIKKFLATDPPVSTICGEVLAAWRRLRGNGEGKLAALANAYFQTNPVNNPFMPLTSYTEEAAETRTLARIFRYNLERGEPLPADLPIPASIKDRLLTACREGSHNTDSMEAEFLRLRKLPLKKSPMPEPQELWRRLEKVLQREGTASFPEMRHEASLSPIALLRDWPVTSTVELPRKTRKLSGTLTAFGRGLSLAQARISLRMEILERLSAFADISFTGEKLALPRLKPQVFLRQECLEGLMDRGENFHAPAPARLLEKYREIPFYWFPGKTSKGRTVWVPAQAVFLFCNLDEPLIFDKAGSTGLGAGVTTAQARLAAALEVVERDALATTPILATEFVRLKSADKMLQALLEDYKARGIYPVFQNISTELGVPAWRCLVFGPGGELAQATAASLSSKQAILSALTETPWPYVWAKPAPFGKKSRRLADDLPVLELEELPNYDLGDAGANLLLLERVLKNAGIEPVYCDIGQERLEFPVCRAFLPNLETHAEFDGVYAPSPRLLARSLRKL